MSVHRNDLVQEIRRIQKLIINLGNYENRDDQIQTLEHKLENLQYELKHAKF